MPTIVAGDFNAQPGSYGLTAMPDRLRDSFYEAGSGWCHTAVNDYPLARIDQIWISPEIVAFQSKVQKTVNSDHRMVICDLAISPLD
jgi:endonuclease/exonuclease/phosphatase (EEP) superfamily protein YafD